MKVILIFALMIAAVSAGAISPNVVASLLGGGAASPSIRSEVSVKDYFNEIYPNGNYKFYYVLSDGSSRSEEGEVKNEGLENQYIAVNGHYEYKSPDNVLRTVVYDSGIEGYKPVVKEA